MLLEAELAGARPDGVHHALLGAGMPQVAPGDMAQPGGKDVFVGKHIDGADVMK